MRRFLGLNFIQFVYIEFITCTFIILYGQECLNHGGSNSIQGGNRKFFGCTQWSTIELEIICWKYVLYEYTVTPSLLNSILSGSVLMLIRYLTCYQFAFSQQLKLLMVKLPLQLSLQVSPQLGLKLSKAVVQLLLDLKCGSISF